MAEGLRERSRGRIKTGIYHADIEAERKQTLHEKWREGSVKVVCATIGEWCYRQFEGTHQNFRFSIRAWNRQERRPLRSPPFSTCKVWETMSSLTEPRRHQWVLHYRYTFTILIPLEENCRGLLSGIWARRSGWERLGLRSVLSTPGRSVHPDDGPRCD